MIRSITVKQKLTVGKTLFLVEWEAIQSLRIVKAPYFDRCWKMDVVQYPHEIMARTLYLGDLGVIGYRYDERPCLLQPTVQAARSARIKFKQWAENKPFR